MKQTDSMAGCRGEAEGVWRRSDWATWQLDVKPEGGVPSG